MSDATPSRLHALVAVLVAAGLLAGIHWEALSGARVLSPADMLLQHEPWRSDAPDGFVPGNPILSDQVTQFQPWFRFAEERLADGELPLWNPHAAAGQPFLANLQSGVFSPVSLLHRLLSFETALLVAALLKVLVAAAFTALLARALGASVCAASVSALAFSFGGFQTLWLGWPQATTSTFLPVLLFLTERAFARGPRRWDGPVFGLSVGAMLLSGHVETALHVSLATGLYAVARALIGPRAASGWRTLLRLGAWSLCGLALAAVQLVPFVEYLLHSHAWADRVGFGEVWRDVPFEQAPGWLVLGGLLLLLAVLVRAAIGPPVVERSPCDAPLRHPIVLVIIVALVAALVLRLAEDLGLSPFHRLLVHPDAFGHPVPARALPWAGPRSYVNANGGYTGLVPLGLAFVALLSGPRRHVGVRIFAGLGALAFVVAYQVPGLAALANRLPLLSVSHNDRLMLLVNVSIAMLAGFGLDVLLGLGRAPRRRPGAVVGVGLALAVAFAAVPFVPVPDDTANQLTRPADERPQEPERAVDDAAWVANPAPRLLAGGVQAVTKPLTDGEALPVRGWAVAAEGSLSVEVEVVQAARRTAIVLTAADFGPPQLPVPLTEIRPEVLEICGFARDVPLDEYEAGPVWLRVTLVSGERRVLIEDRAIRWQPDRPVALRWWLLGAASLLLLALLLRVGRRRPRLAGALCLALVAVDLAAFGWDFNPSAERDHLWPDTPVLNWLSERRDEGRVWAVGESLLAANTAGVYGLSDLRSYDAMEVESFERFLWLLRPPPTRALAPGEVLDVTHPLFGLTDVAHVLAPTSWAPPPGAPLRAVFEHGGTVVFAYEGVRAHAMLVPRAESLDVYLETVPRSDLHPVQAARAHARNVATGLAGMYETRRWQDVVVIEGPAPRVPAPGEPVAPVTPLEASVTPLERAPERLAWETRSDRAAWLVVSEAWFPGWTARVDGESVDIHRAFLGLRALRVPSGTHRVEMSYEPWSFPVGLGVTAAALLLLLLAPVWTARSARRGIPPAGPPEDVASPPAGSGLAESGQAD